MKLCFEENQIHLNIFISCAMTGLNFLPGGFNQSITVWEVHQSPVPENFWRKSVFCFQNRIAESATWLTALLSHVLQYQHATTCWWPAQRLAFIQILREGFGKKEIINDFCHFLVHFFICNWIFHIWNGFYTWSQSKISFFSPFIIGLELTFIVTLTTI